MRGTREGKLWNEFVARYHYLGYKTLVGAQMRYAVHDRNGWPLAMLGFSTAAWKLAPRDTFIGWTRQLREKNLPFVVDNPRFLILPWIKIPNLGSHILAIIRRRLPEDWTERYNTTPVLIETFASSCFSMVQVGVKLLRRCFKRVFCVPLFSPQQFYIVQHLNVDPKPGIFGRSRGPGSPSASPRDVINPGEVRVFGFASVQSRP